MASRYSIFILRYILPVLFAVVAPSSVAQGKLTISGDLKRQADLGFAFGAKDGSLAVESVTEGSAAAAAGLAKGDQIVAIDGQPYAKTYIGEAMLRRLKGGEEIALEIGASSQKRTVRFTPPAKPWESLSGLDTYIGAITTPDGARLRTIITRPAGTVGRLPTLFFVQWSGCDTVEFTGAGPWVEVYKGLAQRSGYTMIRIERSANGGDSEGPACHELDFDTELSHYRYAYSKLTVSPHVDRDRVAIVGNSLGSMMAPFVAQGNRVRGITVASGGGLTFFERMVYFDRQALERRAGAAPQDIHDKLMDQVRFHVAYLLDGKTPEQISEENPKLGAVWKQIPFTGDGVHYGRPYAFHHQLAKKNMLGAWASIEAPALVIYNEFDQFESLKGAESIVDTMNRLRLGSAELARFPNVDHSFFKYPSADMAYQRVRAQRTNAPEPAIDRTLLWLKKIVEGPR
jgi:pimeloyl-ACP methyl ester carboxylesterase